MNNTSGSGTGSGSVFISPGATLGGNGSITGFTTIQNGGHLAPGSSPGKVGTFTIQGLSLDTSTLDYEGDGAGVDRLNVGSDGFAASGVSTINVSNLGGLASGDYVIIDYTNGSPDISNFTLGPAPSGYNLSLSQDVDNTNFILHVVSSGPPQWAVDAGGSWSTASNWTGGIPNSPTAIANFLGKITAPRTVTLDGSKQVQQITFDNANKYTIAPGSGGILTVGNGSSGSITVANGTHEISAPLAFSGAITKSGGGTLIISGTQTHAAGSSLAVTAGQLNLNSNAGSAASGSTAAAAPLSISISGAGSKVVASADQNLANLSLSTADADTQGFDLNTPATAGAFRSIHVYASDLASAKTSLYAAIKNANANPGDGIFDSGLAAHAGSKIGLAQVADAHGEQNIFIRPAKVGDLNLDGQVTISDFIDLASNFNSSGKTWQEGDLNYDGAVTISDFIDLASNFGSSYSGASSPINPSDQLSLSNFASSIEVDASVIGSAVPEPGTLSLLAIGALGLLPRHRQNRRK